MLNNLRNDLRLVKKYLLKYLTRENTNYLFVVAAGLIGFYLDWNIATVLGFCFLIWFILMPLRSEILLKASIILILLIPLLIFIRRGERAEQASIFAFFALCLAWIKGYFEVKKIKSE